MGGFPAAATTVRFLLATGRRWGGVWVIYVWKRTRTAASGEKINDVFKVAGENNIGIRGVTIVVICALRNETKSKPRVVGVECPGRPVR